MNINFKSNGWDAMVVALGNRGMTAKAIARETGLSESQVRTRLSKQGLHLWDVRNGITPQARHQLAEVRRALKASYSTLRVRRTER